MTKLHARRVFRQGDSLVITIPAELARELKIKEGDEVIIENVSGDVVVRKYFQ
jgi:AbrB family looped-hinge helix DNA binding protein